jgi:hypothetical protein
VANASYSSSGTPIVMGNPLDNLPQSPVVDPKITSLVFSDFKFIQDGKVLSFLDTSKLLINGAKNLKIAIDYDRVPEVLKTIAITLALPDDPSQHFSFLLHANKDKTAYEASIAPLLKVGEYGIHIAVIDYKNRSLKKIDGSLLASVESAELIPAAFPESKTASVLLLGVIIKLFAMVALFFQLIRVFVRDVRALRLAKAYAKNK